MDLAFLTSDPRRVATGGRGPDPQRAARSPESPAERPASFLRGVWTEESLGSRIRFLGGTEPDCAAPGVDRACVRRCDRNAARGNLEVACRHTRERRSMESRGPVDG